MNDDDPQTVNRMLLYFYTLDYPDEDVPTVRAEHVAVDQSPLPHRWRKTSNTTEEETDPGTASDGAAPHDPRVMNNALVYAVAEKYDIPELKDLAKHKFQTLASSKWPHDGFHAITECIFTTTPDNDMGLRQIVLDICAEHFYDILKDEESRAGLLENQAIADVVLDAAVRKIDRDRMLLDEAVAKQIAIRKEYCQADADKQEAVRQKYMWMSQLDSLFERANEVQKCRHCHENLQWCLERLPSSLYDELRIQLRCGSCRTKEAL